MSASIIILTKNAGQRFKGLLNRIYSQSYRDFEIIAVDSGSTDGTLETAEEYNCRIQAVPPEEFHHSKTRNSGAELAEGEFLVFLTQDALPLNHHWLENLLAPFEDENVAGVYGRQIAYPDSNPIEKFFYSYFYPDQSRRITPESLHDLAEFYISNVFVSDVSSAMRKEVWEEIRFDEDIFMAEDKKWGIDALRAGYSLIYEPQAVVHHSHEYSLTTAFKRRFDDGAAMKQICNSGGVASRGFSYLAKEMRYLAENNKKWIPYALVYDVVKFAGFGLGRNYKHFPNSLKRKISKHNHYW